jgi:hypothetical protein
MSLVQKSAEVAVYFTDRGIEEPGERRGEDQVTPGWLAARLQAFAGLHPGSGVPADRLAGHLAGPRRRRGRRAVNRVSPGSLAGG